MSGFYDYLRQLKKKPMSKAEELERQRLETYTINKYGNYLIRRNEIDKYKQKYKNLKVKELNPEDENLVIIEIKNRKRNKND